MIYIVGHKFPVTKTGNNMINKRIEKLINAYGGKFQYDVTYSVHHISKTDDNKVKYQFLSNMGEMFDCDFVSVGDAERVISTLSNKTDELGAMRAAIMKNLASS